MKISTFTVLSLCFIGTNGFSTICQNQNQKCQNSRNVWRLQASSRRNFLSGAAAAVAFVSVSQRVEALDMDAFINDTIESDTKNCDPKRDPKCIPKLTEAEALCKYGQSGQARADACKAVKASGGKMPEKGKEGKSLGGAYAM